MVGADSTGPAQPAAANSNQYILMDSMFAEGGSDSTIQKQVYSHLFQMGKPTWGHIVTFEGMKFDNLGHIILHFTITPGEAIRMMEEALVPVPDPGWLSRWLSIFEYPESIFLDNGNHFINEGLKTFSAPSIVRRTTCVKMTIISGRCGLVSRLWTSLRGTNTTKQSLRTAH
ncbi:hypothetical protein GGTG_01489 [Gaeumannomyces tritici R3-111a-1]|uniref:Uncharacterized protein n=1 Tax=Gaeumannomyces tritici (strain R3-111a-1) TaxID=644352 RepID=J3NJQ9_GAET3|nr:hypothetical protein GGTG_01489 [Gaeumannomyces tritici R3-111a-1]EJT81511.1 hypothetical protein GGTG_01489 [Gaeumannomyces tritici R3-111a-1]